MKNSIRLIGLGMSLMMFAAVWPLGVSAQSSGPEAATVCVQFAHGKNFGLLTRIVAAGQACRVGETAMMVVASKTQPFMAQGSRPVGSQGGGRGVLESTITALDVSVPESAPLFLAITLQVNTDRGMFTIPTSARGSSLGCMPLVDGRRAGAAQKLSSNAQAAGMASVRGMYDPRTGGFDQFAPGDYPDTSWSMTQQFHHVAAGPHEVAVECEAHAPFSFRGVATLIAMQPAPAN